MRHGDLSAGLETAQASVIVRRRAQKSSTMRGSQAQLPLDSGKTRLNDVNTYEFLKELRQEYGRLIILLDSASYHRYRAVNEFVKSTCGEIKLAYLLPYTTQLNPIEIQWRVLKENACEKVLRIDRRPCRCNNRPDRFGPDEASQADEIPRSLNDESNPHGNTCP